MKASFYFLFWGLLCSMQMQAQMSAKLIQHPDVSKTHVVFTYGNDLWIVPKTGGQASRLSSPVGRETNARFSPDGNTVAFEANYDGNQDLYTLDIRGGVPKRVTGHGMDEIIQDWYPDGKSILYTSSMESGKQRFQQFYRVAAEGGLPQKLPVAVAANGSLSPDGTKIAFTEKTRIYRTWKRYRGGTAADIYVMDLNTLQSENITNSAANDELPMFHGTDIFYLSDRDENKRFNIWKYNMLTKQHAQITRFTEYDIHYPAIGPDDMVFEAGGKLYIMDLTTFTPKEVMIHATGDFNAIKPVSKNVGGNIVYFNISPDGNRALAESRGDVFTLPKENGITENITRSSGTFERYPAWSPDGRYLAYFSDASGEYELTLRDLKTRTEKTITKLGPGFRYNIYWSPDSKKVVYVDQTMRIHLTDITTGATDVIDQDISLFEGGLRRFKASWSGDSRYITYPITQANGNGAIFIFDSKTKKSTKVTSGYFSDNNPVFDREGKYIFFTTNRSFNPIYSDFENTWVYANATKIAALPLTKEVLSPLAEKNDTVAIVLEEVKPDKKEDKKADKKKKDSKEAETTDEKKIKDVVIDFDRMESRVVVLPVTGGNIGGIAAAEGKLVYLKFPNSGVSEGKGELKYYDIDKKEEKTILADCNGFELSADGKSVIAANSSNQMAIVKADADQKYDKPINTSGMVCMINPREEWKQIFNDVWRLERDFFYDKSMHGVDWAAMKVKYGKLIDECVTRHDVNFVIGELIGEMNASHTYRGGGDDQNAPRKNTGYLGIDWGKKDGEFYVKRIIQAGDWDTEVRSPLAEPGIQVQEGDYILSVNGMPLRDFTDPWIAFTDMAEKPVELMVGKTTDITKAQKVLVKTLRDETRLRNLAWIENNRKIVDEASNGEIGYVYVPSTGVEDGQYDLVRMFYAQWHKKGLIIDERFNNGGQIPDRFVELLNRKPLAYFNVRDGKDWQWPPVGHFGPKAMLINGWSGSGGDAFPDYFRKAGLGPLIGTRTWGGLIGISGCPGLIDGGTVTVPTFRMYNPDGTWFPEGYGVDPDIEVKEDPTSLARGTDVQLQKAIDEVLKQLKNKPNQHPAAPGKEDRSK